MSWLRAAVAILLKDIRSEVRTRAALNAVLLFAVVTLAMVSYALGGARLTPEIHAALVWIILFFAAMAGLSRSFVVEAERGTERALRLAASASQIYLGKLLFNLALLGMLDAILVPLFQILLPLHGIHWGLFLAGLALGSVALAAATTLVAAIVAQAGVKGALFTVLSFPILMPVLIAGVGITRKAMEETPGSAATEIQLLISYAGVMITLAFLLIDFVWRE